jgi:hypothetical protein
MLRLTLTAVLVSIALLVAAPGAAAKNVTSMRVCGPDRCAEIGKAAAQRFHDVGGLEVHALGRKVGRVAFYRVTTFFGDGVDPRAGHFTQAYAPAVKAVLPLDTGTGGWMRVSVRAERRLAQATRGIEPFPPRRLAAVRTVRGDSLPPAVYQPAPAAADDDRNLPLLAGVPAAALLLGLGLVVWRRRR